MVPALLWPPWCILLWCQGGLRSPVDAIVSAMDDPSEPDPASSCTHHPSESPGSPPLSPLSATANASPASCCIEDHLRVLWWEYVPAPPIHQRREIPFLRGPSLPVSALAFVKHRLSPPIQTCMIAFWCPTGFWSHKFNTYGVNSPPEATCEVWIPQYRSLPCRIFVQISTARLLWSSNQENHKGWHAPTQLGHLSSCIFQLWNSSSRMKESITRVDWSTVAGYVTVLWSALLDGCVTAPLRHLFTRMTMLLMTMMIISIALDRCS